MNPRDSLGKGVCRLWVVVFVLGLLGCRGTTEPDTVPPAAVSDLEAAADGAVVLAWAAVGDDGLGGTADRYDIRLAAEPIGAGVWDRATAVADPPAPRTADRRESYRLDGLAPDAAAYLALRVVDDGGNRPGSRTSCASVAALATARLRPESGTWPWRNWPRRVSACPGRRSGMTA